jgi:hypothetical protein
LHDWERRKRKKENESGFELELGERVTTSVRDSEK